MKLNLKKDQHQNEIHSGEVFPKAADPQFAYQGEGVRGGKLVIEAHPPYRQGGKLNWDLAHPDYDSYELEISGTGRALEIKLIGHRNDIVPQRRSHGRANYTDAIITAMSFGEFCNLIFGKGEHPIFHEGDRFPREIENLIRHAYPDRPDRNDWSDWEV